jgi:hypothetical protein
MDDDDDFWTTWIAVTPDEDKHFAGCGRWLLIFAGMILAWLVAVVALGSPVEVVNGGSGTVTTQGVINTDESILVLAFRPISSNRQPHETEDAENDAGRLRDWHSQYITDGIETKLGIRTGWACRHCGTNPL